MSPYRPLFVDAEAAIEAERELERIRERQRVLVSWLDYIGRGYADYHAESRFRSYGLSITWPRGATLGFSDLLRDL